ncbi:MdfA family multidrug efflux MFS transporter [Legionella birminghamensis]
MSQPLINITRKQALYFAGFLVLYQFLTYIANDMIMPGMIHVVASFNGSESSIATSLTVYVLGGASLQLFLGPLSDAFGRRPVMLTGVALFLIFTLWIAASNSMAQFLMARYFQGMGLCFTAVVGYATLQEIFAEMDAIRLIAILSNVASLAPLVGPLAGAGFILLFHWRGIFLLIAFLAVAAMLGLKYFMPESVGAVKKDGEIIPKISLAPKIVANNYRRLLLNSEFMIGAIASGIMAIPCIAWIAISPIILVTDAQLSVIQYALWQLPIFSAGIAGNFYLRWLTTHRSVKQIIINGSFIFSFGLLLCYLLPLLFSSSYIWLMPGLVIYGFSLGALTAPLTRHVLFSTAIAKGTAYAMISLISMCAQALGVEIANRVYVAHNNLHFGLFCFGAGIAYLLGLSLMFKLSSKRISGGLSQSAPVV